jgi:ribulose 1,5-bisphosphate carboxylase large subunit-like protein
MADIPIEQQAHRIAFGKSITAWMRLNGWSQQTMHDAAKACRPYCSAASSTPSHNSGYR